MTTLSAPSVSALSTPTREAFGIVSKDEIRGYKIFDVGQVADLVVAGLKDAGMLSGTKCEIMYDRETTRYDIRAILPAPVSIPDHRGVGRVSSLFARFTGRDDGMGSVEGSMGALIFRCMNASIAQTEGASWRKVHKGKNVGEIARLVANMSESFGSVASDLIAVWTRASAEYYLDSESGARLSVPEAIARMIADKSIPTGGVSAEAALDTYTAAWREEGSPYSAAGVIDSLTRAAREGSWSTRWATVEIEEAASNLLYQSVYTLDAPEVATA